MVLKAVLFDLDNTLFDFNTSHKQALREMGDYGEARFDIPAQHFIHMYHKADRQIKRELPYVAAGHNRAIILQRMLEMMRLPSIVTPLELYETYWSSMLRTIKPREGVVEFLRRLERKGIRTGICTDMTAHIQHRKLMALGLTNYIDRMVTSEESGIEKPDPKIFFDCLRKLDAQPNQAVFIGDSFERDVCGAHAAGILPFWLNVTHTLAPEADFPFKEIHSFKELL